MTANGREHESEPQKSLVGGDPGKLRQVKLSEMAIRFGFGAAVSVAAGLVSVAFGPKAGGMFLAFPAILPASLTLLAKKEGPDSAVEDVRGAVLGAFGLVAFAIVATLALSWLPVGVALLLSLTAWLAVALVSYLLQAALRRWIEPPQTTDTAEISTATSGEMAKADSRSIRLPS